jgi:hypothetical protein
MSATVMQPPRESRDFAAEKPDAPIVEKQIACRECGASFTPAHPRQKFCSDAHRIAHWKRENEELAPKTAKTRILKMLAEVKALRAAVVEHERARLAAEEKLLRYEAEEVQRVETVKKQDEERRVKTFAALIGLADLKKVRGPNGSIPDWDKVVERGHQSLSTELLEQILNFADAPELVYALSQNERLLRELSAVPLGSACSWLMRWYIDRAQSQMFLQAANSLADGG